MKRLFILLGWCMLTVFTLHAQNYILPEQPEHPLTKAQVRRFLKAEIEIDKLQKNIQAHKGEYEQLKRGEIKVFYAKRDQILKSRGYKPDEYDKIRNRVFQARSNIKAYEDYKKQHQLHQKKAQNNVYEQNEQAADSEMQKVIDEIRKNDFLSDKKKKEMIAQMKILKSRMEGSSTKIKKIDKIGDDQRYQRLTRYKADWPAVRPYLNELKQLSEWYSGSVAEPPIIK